MVIVAAIAVSTMVSNHIVMPIALQFLSSDRQVSGDVRNLLLTSRRLSIAAVLALGFLYFRLSGGSDALAAIGLIAFVGVAQFLPSLLGGIFWRGATRTGAVAGLLVGFALWAFTLFLPSFGEGFPFDPTIVSEGLFGIAALRPHALLGLDGLDPLVHALVWSLGANVVVFLIGSGLSEPRPLERLQGALFVDVYRNAGDQRPQFVASDATSEDLFVLAQRILGATPARELFDQLAREQGRARGLPHPNDAVVLRLERVLAGSIGAASAHAMVGRVVGHENVSMTELIDIADETQRLIETSQQLSEKSNELERAASQVREANERLRTLDAQKDDFLSQVSHELRTPMTSIRSFSEILKAPESVDAADRARFIAIIHDESLRLTRLLDEILDINRLEAGRAEFPVRAIRPQEVIDAAVGTISGVARMHNVQVRQTAAPADVWVEANEDRMRQALINLLSNAVKYNTDPEPTIHIRASVVAQDLNIDIVDNGGGVDRDEAKSVFEKFRRGRMSHRDQGAGLGLPITRAIMRSMGGDLSVEFAPDGTSFFRLRLVTCTAP